MNTFSKNLKSIIWVVIVVITLFEYQPVFAQKRENNKPNIIYIFTDQQHANMMSCAGNKWLKTPAMDYIAENGVRFTRAYCANPVCVPSRISMMTGRFAGEFKDVNGKRVRENEGGSFNFSEESLSPEARNSTLPAYLKKAGYDLYYGGKTHLPKPLMPRQSGFNIISTDERDQLASDAANFLKQKHDKPFYLTLSFINPHDICYMALLDNSSPEIKAKIRKGAIKQLDALNRALQLPEGVSKDEFFSQYCPPLPANFAPPEDEPKAIKKMLEIRDFRIKARENYTEEQWRMHRWAYARLTEEVDRQIQVVLDALKESGQLENTLVIFSSDHGDMDATHRMEHKNALNEESAGIPFMVMWKDRIEGGRVDSTHLISNGLDLLPTVCDYAGIKAVADPRGLSIRPLLEGKKVNWRKTLGVETEMGYMVVSHDGFKYMRYDWLGREERLIDLNKDPYETRYFTNEASHSKVLVGLRKSFDKEWFPNY